MDISLTLGNEHISFNLFTELNINTADINHEVTRQAQIYGFLGLAQAKLAHSLERAERRKDLLYERAYLKAKQPKTGGRPNSDDVCKATARVNSKYQLALKNYLDIKNQLKTINNVLEAFKQRKDLLQTFSSNNRNNN